MGSNCSLFSPHRCLIWNRLIFILTWSWHWLLQIFIYIFLFCSLFFCLFCVYWVSKKKNPLLRGRLDVLNWRMNRPNLFDFLLKRILYQRCPRKHSVLTTTPPPAPRLLLFPFHGCRLISFCTVLFIIYHALTIPLWAGAPLSCWLALGHRSRPCFPPFSRCPRPKLQP